MGSNEEMFERGVRDAEQDELNGFYYQHYYHYRRGYDRARRRIRHAPTGAVDSAGQTRRLPLIGLGLLALVAVLVLVYGTWGRTPSPATSSTGVDAATAPAIQVSVPTRIPRIPTETPVPPTPLPPTLQLQGAAVIVNSGAPLRLRAGAGTTHKVVGRLPEGTAVKLVEGPVESDGYTWWRVEAGENNGWIAERSQDGVVWLQPQP